MAKVRRRHARFLERLRGGRELHSLSEIMPQDFAMITRRRTIGLAALIAKATSGMTADQIRAAAKKAAKAGITSPFWNGLLRAADGRDLKDQREMESMRRSAFRAFARQGADPTMTIGEAVLSDLRESRRPIRLQTIQQAVLAELGMRETGGAAAHGGGDARDGRAALRRTPKGAVTKSGGSVPVVGEVTASKILPWDDSVQQQPTEKIAVGGIPKAGSSEAYVTQPRRPQDWKQREAMAATTYGQLLRNESPMGDDVWDDEDPVAAAMQDRANRLAGQTEGEGGEDEGDMTPTGYDWIDDGDVAGGLRHTIRDGVIAAKLTDDSDARQNILDAVRALGQVHQDLTGEPGLDEDEIELYMSEDEPERARIRGDEDEAGRGRRMRGSEGNVSAIKTYAAEAPVHRASSVERAVLADIQDFNRSVRTCR